jgi:hypothetical protein
MMKKIFLLISFVGVIFLAEETSPVLAYQIQDLVEVPVKGDFVLGPGKTELWLGPGEKAIKELLITNRLGRTMTFKIELEDFTGSYNPERPVVLLGREKGPYSLKEYLKPEITEFTLSHGQRMILPVEISIPADAEPGGLYGAVLVSTTLPELKTEVEKEKAKGQIGIITRLGTLFFIRIKGEVLESGSLKSFKVLKKYYETGPVNFELLFENTGNVHLMPYGVIEIKNLFGKKVDKVQIDPYFAMPDSLRAREVKWDRKLAFGKYTALLSLNRGYKDLIDQASASFWVMPWKIILGGMVSFFLIIWFFWWVATHFEIKRKH